MASKASEWAARDKARVAKLEAARERIETELGEDGKLKPGPFLFKSNILGTVTHWDGVPHLEIRAYSGPLHLDSERAIEFARWILAIFTDKPAR